MQLKDYLISNPDKFIDELKQQPDYLSVEMAKEIDEHDPLAHTSFNFDFRKIIPLAGHSLGPSFMPTFQAIKDVSDLQAELIHGGHFVETHPEGKISANWFDCDRLEPALLGAQQLLGFKEMHEFNFTAKGLSENLGMLLETFYHPGAKDWKSGKTKICMLSSEFFSDQAVINSVMQRAIITAKNFECFENKEIPTTNNEILKINPNELGIYKTQDIIDTIKQHIDTIKVICLPDIVFNTGQRLELDKILVPLQQTLKEKGIKVILDLAHTVGNRSINLEALQVTAAVGCGYKHLSGPAGSPFGIYVNRNVDLTEFPPIQGWKSADPKRVFATINKYDPQIMNSKEGALAFRTSNPPPVPLLPAQVFLATFSEIGFDKCFNKSECLTRYLILQLQENLGDKIQIITPMDPNQRGATIAFSLKEKIDLKEVETKLKTIGYDIDTRPPNIIRVTAHYAYNSFKHISSFIRDFKDLLTAKPNNKMDTSEKSNSSYSAKIMLEMGFGANFSQTKETPEEANKEEKASKTFSNL